MAKRSVSIALATYNGAQFLPAQLASLATQTRLPDELVVGDDGSTDDTLAILGQFAAQAPFPVRITRNAQNLGHAHNFVTTMQRCSGELVFPCDQDDIWRADKIAVMVAQLDANPGAWLATHDAALIDEDESPLGLTIAGQLRAAGADPASGVIAGCCMAIDRRLLALFDPVPRLRQHDAWLAAAADLAGLRTFVDLPLIDYRRHGGNASASFMSSGRAANRVVRIVDRMGKARAVPVREALEWAVAGREDLIAALTRHAPLLAEVVPAAQLEAALRRELPRLASDRRRLALHDAPRHERPALLIGAVLAGTYRGGSGMLSLLRDLAAMGRKEHVR